MARDGAFSGKGSRVRKPMDNWKTIQGTESALGANCSLCLSLIVNMASFLMFAAFLSAYLLWTALTPIYSFPSLNSREKGLTDLASNHYSYWEEPMIPPHKSPANCGLTTFFRPPSLDCTHNQ